MENTIVGTQPFALSGDIETEGFDIQAGATWIYPTNYPTRDYQYNIIQKALLTNTLVSLPTGLGKTFIAAVVMYNIYRWYPHGKIIFMAPTKPLVKQQVDACYNIMAIPPEVTAELTGAKTSSSRTNMWAEKRVFFVTPQVLQNDLNNIAELGPKIKCLVFDEAHRAKGNHAFCEVIRRLLAQNHKYFRVLALSATPGSTVNDVLEVIQNLLISHIEFRTEESLDVAPYVFQRSLETVVVPLGRKLEKVRDEYLQIVEQYVKTLIKYNVIHGNCASLTKGKIFMIMKEFQNRNRGSNASHYSEIMRCLNICVTLYHAFELLIRHGLRSFLSFYDEHIEKPLLRGNTQLRSILRDVREYLGPIPNIEVLPDGSYPEIPKGITFGHPKYYKLRDVLVSHFNEAKENSRVIVFFEYRESVMEARIMLLQSRPLIQPKIFLGQGSGITQKVQLGVVKAFREGKCNTLLSTCIGEEGLDVGEVDLIICFDISNKSPIRMVQRMGRTGRRREGRIVVLVTEGREQQTLKDCLIHKNNISSFVLESKQLNTGMYPDSPILVPKNLTPRCEKMFITVKKIVKKNSVMDMLRSLSSHSSELVFSQEVDVHDIQERIPKPIMLFNKTRPLCKGENIEENRIFYNFIENQRSAQKTHRVKHSRYTNILTDLLCSADSKRFNIPTQIQSLTQWNAGKNLKQGDIRNMFIRTNTQLDFQSSQKTIEEDLPTQIIEKLTEDPTDISGDLNTSKELFTLISSYLFTQIANPSAECRYCPHDFHCEDFSLSSAQPLLTNNNWVPSEDILDTISLTDLQNFTKSVDRFYESTVGPSIQPDESAIMDIADSQILNNINFTQLEKEAEINKSLLAETERSFHFEAPKNFSNLFSKFGNSIFMSQKTTQATKQLDTDSKKPSQISEKSLLDFFMLESLTDIYSNTSLDSSQSTVIYSQTLPDLDTNDDNLCYTSESPSPVLSLGERRKKRIRSKAAQRSEESPMKRTRTCQHFITDVQLTTEDNSFDNQISTIDINDFCDLSSFGILNVKSDKVDVNKSELVDIEQICNLADFGLLARNDTTSTKNTDLSDDHIHDCTGRDIRKNNDKYDNLFVDIFSQNKLSRNMNKENYINNLNCSADNLSNNTSSPREIYCDKTSNFQTSVNYQTTQNKTVLDMNKTFADVDFNLLTQPTDFTKKGYSKLNVSQKSSIDEHEVSQVVEMPTRPNNSSKTNILSESSEGENKDNLNLPTVEKEIECIDLTLLSPTSTKENSILSCESLIPITQMLSLLNKTTQKENLKDNSKVSSATLVTKEPLLNKSKNSWLSKLSTKKNTNKENTLLKAQPKGVRMNDVDPYSFPSNSHRNDQKSIEQLSTSSDEFEDSVFLKPRNTILKKNGKEQSKRCKKKTNDFLDLEAQLSEDEKLLVSEDEDEGANDFYEKSFINDETQNLDTQMHAKYLQSVRSPANPRRFKIPIKSVVNITNVYSQPPSTELDTYVEDSFCVDNDDGQFTEKNELSPLEILEKELREKKRKISGKKYLSKPKRRRVICLDSDDSD